MSRTTYVSAVDKVLKPMGFVREGRCWTRMVGSVEQCVDLQTSQIAGTTANLWSKDLATEDLLQKAAPWMQPAFMVVFPTRIGQLMSGRDRWWKNDPNGPAELAEALQEHAPRFFERELSLEDQARQFGRFSTSKWRYNTSSRIYLALTLYRMGEIEEAYKVLENPPKKIPDNWMRQVEGVRDLIAKSRSSTPNDAENS